MASGECTMINSEDRWQRYDEDDSATQTHEGDGWTAQCSGCAISG